MRKTFRVNAASSSQSIDIDFEAAAVIVNNPTASPVYFRLGAPDIPSADNADLLVPAGESIAWPVTGYSFGVALGSPSSIPASNIPASGLFGTCIVTFVDSKETVPTFGSASFLSLSTSDLFSSPTGAGFFVFPVIDIGAWGGAVIFIAPNSASGQHILRLEVSTDRVTWVVAGQWAFWPSIPATLNVARVARYIRISTVDSGIPGEPVPQYFLTARASLTEIQQTSYVPYTTSVQKVLNVPNLGEQDFVLCTMNTPAIDVSIDVTSVGSGSCAEEIICETSVAPTGPWQTASFHEQNAAPLTGDLFRSYGNLNSFTRIRILEIGNGGPIGGTIAFSIRPEPDLSNILQLIFAALGSVAYSPNSNQDIYHELDSIRLTSGSINTGIGTLHTDLTTTNNWLASINGNMANTVTNTGNTAANTGNTASNTASIATNMATEVANTGTIVAALTRNTPFTSLAAALPAPGAWVDLGAFIIPGYYITVIQPSFANNAAMGGSVSIFAVGVGDPTFGGIQVAIIQTYINAPPVSAWTGPVYNMSSIRSPGYLIPAGYHHIYLLSTILAGNGAVTYGMVPP